MIANFIDMSIYRYIGDIFLWIYHMIDTLNGVSMTALPTMLTPFEI